METLFARASVAMQECESRPQTKRQLRAENEVTISRADALSWRGRLHLSEYKVPCLVERKDSPKVILDV